jgi:copper chaperone
MSTTFQVNDMTCGHCVSTITKALASVDKRANVAIDLGSRRVEVTSAQADEAEIQQAIKEAGYSPVLVQPGSAPASLAKPGGCGCGCSQA